MHGDYRFDNTVLGGDRRVVAVLDWELATIGDPVADFAWSLLYWSDPGDEVRFIDDTPTLDPGFPRSAEVVERYAARSGRDLSALGWYRRVRLLEDGLHRRGRVRPPPPGRLRRPGRPRSRGDRGPGRPACSSTQPPPFRGVRRPHWGPRRRAQEPP